MEDKLNNIRTTLNEEILLLQELISLAVQLREALVEADADQVFTVSSRQQTAIVRLKIVRQALQSLHSEVEGRDELGYPTGLRTFMEQHGDNDDLALIRTVEENILQLARENAVADRLLSKQLQSVNAFQHIFDQATGVESVYNRSGGMQKSAIARKFEHRG